MEKLKDSWLVEKESQEFETPGKSDLGQICPGDRVIGGGPQIRIHVLSVEFGEEVFLSSCLCGRCSLPATLFVIVSVLQFLVVLFLSFCLFYYFLSATVVC